MDGWRPPSSALGAGDPGPPQATVPPGDLIQVLLVVLLGVEERLGLRDLRGDGPEPALRQDLRETTGMSSSGRRSEVMEL